MGLFDNSKKKEIAYICSRCRKKLAKNQISEQYSKCLCGECAKRIKLTYDQIEVAEKIVDEYISYNNLCLTQFFIENVKTRVKKILAEHLKDAENHYLFYWSEYPMGAIHSKELIKIDSIWHIVQYDYDKNPSETRIPYPEINDDNLVEHLVKFIIEEEIKPNVQNQNTHVEPTQSPTFVCAQCKMVFPMKYMHKQDICVNCISGSHKDHIPKQLPKEQNEKNRENMLGAKESHECSKESKSIFMQNHISCSCCGAKVQQATVQKFYGQGICPNCYENFRKIVEAIEANIDPYTLPLTNEQREARNSVRGVLVDDVAYVKCKMEKQLFEELYDRDLNCSTSDSASSVYLFNFSEEGRIYFDKKYKIPYVQYWDESEFAFHPSTFRGPSHKYPISFYEVELLAKFVSDTLYEKYKGINVLNWKEYIK